MTPLISIIVPIYNTEKYLSDCLNSIVSQTYTNLEIILVNDGSEDQSLEICRMFKAIDDRIIIVNQENRGVSSARNNGKKYARGKYILFIDADDELTQNMIKILVNDAETNRADITVCGIYEIKDNKTNVKPFNNSISIISNRIAIEKLLSGQEIQSGAWNKLFRADIINNVFFEVDKRMNEDKYFCYCAFSNSNRVVVHDIPLYRYYHRDDSASHSKFTDAWFDAIYFAEEIYKKECIIDKNTEKIARSNLAESIYYIIYLMNVSGAIKEYSDEYKELIDKLRKLKIHDLRRNISTLRYYGMILIKISKKLFEVIAKLCKGRVNKI